MKQNHSDYREGPQALDIRPEVLLLYVPGLLFFGWAPPLDLREVTS
ncbi:hypothetical protein [Mycolicibacterium parafortuitum]